MFLDVAGRRCVVVGGGEVAARKARGLLRAGARVALVSPEVRAEISGMDLELCLRRYEPGDLKGACLAFAATDPRETNAAVAREARECGALVNVADRPEEGDFALPSVLRRGDLQVAVSTGGASPRLARRIRDALEGSFVPEWAGVVRRLGAARRDGRAPGPEVQGEVIRCLSRLRG